MRFWQMKGAPWKPGPEIGNIDFRSLLLGQTSNMHHMVRYFSHCRLWLSLVWLNTCGLLDTCGLPAYGWCSRYRWKNEYVRNYLVMTKPSYWCNVPVYPSLCTTICPKYIVRNLHWLLQRNKHMLKILLWGQFGCVFIATLTLLGFILFGL